jgi:hypothetical protein
VVVTRRLPIRDDHLLRGQDDAPVLKRRAEVVALIEAERLPDGLGDGQLPRALQLAQPGVVDFLIGLGMVAVYAEIIL